MVTEGGQLYTIEGIAAGMIMLLTAYFVINATAVYTPGDAHISDMQLEILGKDALNMMDTRPNASVTKSPLQIIIEKGQGQKFKTLFLNYTNNRTLSSSDHVNFQTKVYYNNRLAVPPQDPIESYDFVSSRNLTGGEHAVRTTKWVIVNIPAGAEGIKERAVLVEVLLWRD